MTQMKRFVTKCKTSVNIERYNTRLSSLAFGIKTALLFFVPLTGAPSAESFSVSGFDSKDFRIASRTAAGCTRFQPRKAPEIPIAKERTARWKCSQTEPQHLQTRWRDVRFSVSTWPQVSSEVYFVVKNGRTSANSKRRVSIFSTFIVLCTYVLCPVSFTWLLLRQPRDITWNSGVSFCQTRGENLSTRLFIEVVGPKNKIKI